MIGIFDSGLGGLSVLAAIARALPCADRVYLADTAHVPYGNKPDGFIRGRVEAIGGHLVAQGCRMLLVACNTATAAAVEALREGGNKRGLTPVLTPVLTPFFPRR